MGYLDALVLLILSLYGLGTVIFIVGLVTDNEKLRLAAVWASVLGFALHSLDLCLFVAVSKKGVLTTGQFYFSLLAWSLLLVYFFLWWRLRLKFLALTAAPLALILFGSSLAVGSLKVLMPEKMAGLFFGLHIGSLFLSLGLLTMAFGAALAFLYLERRIKTKAGLSGFAKGLNLNAFDKVNYWALALGFPLYTVGLLSGFIWARTTWGKFFSWDPKEVAALAVWFMYAFLLHQRIFIGWRGRKTAIMVIWIFAISVISLAGINFLMPTHHSFKPIP